MNGLALTMCYKLKSTIDSDLHLGLKQSKTKQKSEKEPARLSAGGDTLANPRGLRKSLKAGKGLA